MPFDKKATCIKDMSHIPEYFHFSKSGYENCRLLSFLKFLIKVVEKFYSNSHLTKFVPTLVFV